MTGRTPMEAALLDALVLSLDNDAEAERVLRTALPHFERFYQRGVDIARGNAMTPAQTGPRILNKKSIASAPADSVYIGRPSKWGNPFAIGQHGGRFEVIAKYRGWIVQQPKLMADLHELRGRDLVCWCAPFACHGEVLRELANPRGTL